MTVELFGTEYRFCFSFFAVITLMLLTAKSDIVYVCLMSSLLHECGHLLFIYIFSQNPKSVVFGAFGIRIERKGVSSLSYKKEAIIAIAGVGVNLILILVFYIVYLFNGCYIALYGVVVNVFVTLLNLMPIGMLDAGNFLRYILLMHFDQEKTSFVLSAVSDVTVILFTAFCVLYTVFLSLNISLIAVWVYLVVLNFTDIDRKERHFFRRKAENDKQGN